MKRNLRSALLMIDIVVFGVAWLTVRTFQRMTSDKTVARYGHKSK